MSRAVFHAPALRSNSGVAFLVLLAALFPALQLHGAPPPPPPQDPLIALMASQPPIDTSSPVTPTASFEPSVIAPGQQAVYRVTFNALETLVEWPDEIAATPGLDVRLSAHGQVLQIKGSGFAPITEFNCRASSPESGFFGVPAFQIKVNGQLVTVPEARLAVVASTSSSSPPMQIESASTNVYPGQPVTVRVMLLGNDGNVVQGATQIQLNGEGFLVDENSVHQMIKTVHRNGKDVPAFIYEATVLPLAVGTLSVSAQGFTSGNQFNAPVVIQAPAMIPGGPPQYVLYDSDPIQLNVRPLPPEGQLPGFTGAVGDLHCDPPKLATNFLQVGQQVNLAVTVRGEGNLARLAGPLPPMDGSWQVFGPISDEPTPPAPGQAANGKTFTYALIPLVEDARATPAIPFSCFNPAKQAYVDLTIPPVPVTVKPGVLTSDRQALLQLRKATAAATRPPALSDLARTPGRAHASLAPLQWSAGFVCIQLAPIALFAGLWCWDRRRRYLEERPDILLRRRARRALRRERRALDQAARTGDAQRFVSSAVSALRVACAPHYPAEPRALVCGDVLQMLGPDDSKRSGDVARRFFAASDATRFATKRPDAAELLLMHSDLDLLLEQLEARL